MITPKEQLSIFQERVKELKATRFLRTKKYFSIKLFFSEKLDEYKAESILPEEDDLKAFLLTLRQFVSSDEPIYLPKMFKLVISGINDKKLRDLIIPVQRSWNKNQFNVGIKYDINNQELKMRDIWDLYINGKYFHNDPDLIKKWDTFFEPDVATTKFILLLYADKVLTAILFLDAVISMSEKMGKFKIM